MLSPLNLRMLPHTMYGVVECPLQIHGCPESQNVTLFGHRAFAGVISKMRSFWIRVGTKSDMTDVFIRTERPTATHRADSHVKTEAETGIIQL